MNIKSKITSAILLLSCANLFANSFSLHDISFGAKAIFTGNFGTSCEEPEMNNSVEQYKNLGFTENYRAVLNAGGTLFARYNLPFWQPLGVELDFSYLNRNGFVRNLSDTSSDITYSYTFRTIEISPLAAYTIPMNFKNINFDFTFLAGPVFAFPVGNIDYEFNFYDRQTESFSAASHFLPGFTAGACTGIEIKNFEIFLNAQYSFDFTKFQYVSGGKTTDLLQRRGLNLALGLRYTLPARQ